MPQTAPQSTYGLVSGLVTSSPEGNRTRDHHTAADSVDHLDLTANRLHDAGDLANHVEHVAVVVGQHLDSVDAPLLTHKYRLGINLTVVK